jgi:hypothetical protein
MAQAKKEAVKVVETIEYVLRLSADEVDTLIAIFARISGSTDNSPRGHADAIRNALIASGAPGFADTVAYHLITDHAPGRSSVSFNRFPPEAP